MAISPIYTVSSMNYGSGQINSGLARRSPKKIPVIQVKLAQSGRKKVNWTTLEACCRSLRTLAALMSLA